MCGGGEGLVASNMIFIDSTHLHHSVTRQSSALQNVYVKHFVSIKGVYHISSFIFKFQFMINVTRFST